MSQNLDQRNLKRPLENEHAARTRNSIQGSAVVYPPYAYANQPPPPQYNQQQYQGQYIRPGPLVIPHPGPQSVHSAQLQSAHYSNYPSANYQQPNYYQQIPQSPYYPPQPYQYNPLHQQAAKMSIVSPSFAYNNQQMGIPPDPVFLI